jgi:hypothetical protein
MSSAERDVHHPEIGSKRPIFSPVQKLGVLASCILSIGLACLLISLGFLWFLWLADDGNSTWRDIAVRNWVTRAIALSSTVIRQAIAFQASVATAMLAALALERVFVRLSHLASVSTTRNANGGPYMLSWWLWKSFVAHPQRWRTSWLLVLTIIIVITTTLIQLTSFALLSDVDLKTVRGTLSTQVLPTNFRYSKNGTIPVITHGSTWDLTVQSYVDFAEYHEPPQVGLPDGVDDTGLTLRAFLPISDQQSRSMVASWDGVATVLDARVVCLRPQLIDPRVHYADEALAITGAFQLDLTNPDELNFEYVPNNPGLGEKTPSPFACVLPLSAETDQYNSYANTDNQALRSGAFPWRLVICQPMGILADTSYILKSEFGDPEGDLRASTPGDPNFSNGNAYLMINVSSGLEKDWAAGIPGEDPNLGIFRGDGTAPLAYSQHGINNEWYDLLWSSDGHLNLSLSVCYTAFDTADLHVQIESSMNHSDVSSKWDRAAKAYDFSDVRVQLGQGADGKASYSNTSVARNIMGLAKRQSWVPQPDFGDYVVPSNRVTQTSWITDYANMAGSVQNNAFDYTVGANYTSIMWQAYTTPNLWKDTISYDLADGSLSGLLQEILRNGGSLAFGMQSVVTVLAQLAYYQQLQQLNDDSSVTSSHYYLVSAPTRKRGIIVVTVVVTVHIFTTFVLVLPAFLKLTRISALGNAWQVVAQICDDEKTRPILHKAFLAKDDEALTAALVMSGATKQELKQRKKARNRVMAGIAFSPDGERTKVVSLSTAPARESNDLESASSGIKATSDARSNVAAPVTMSHNGGHGEDTALLSSGDDARHERSA